MLLFADPRGSPAPDERFARCLYCGRELVVLPEDRRRGACFDCLALAVAPATACPQCGSTIPGDERALGCPECRWYPARD